MSADKYPCIFSRQIEAIVYLYNHRDYKVRVIPLKLYLDIVYRFSADISCASPEYFRGGSLHVSFRFKVKENFQRCGDVFFDISITSKGLSSLGMFRNF